MGILSTNQYESLDQGRGSGISQQVILKLITILKLFTHGFGDFFLDCLNIGF